VSALVAELRRNSRGNSRTASELESRQVWTLTRALRLSP